MFTPDMSVTTGVRREKTRPRGQAPAPLSRPENRATPGETVRELAHCWGTGFRDHRGSWDLRMVLCTVHRFLEIVAD